MWTRVELKTRAKAMLHKCFWLAVAVCLISAIFTGEFSSGSSNFSNSSNSWNSLQNTYDNIWDDGYDDYYNDDYYEDDYNLYNDTGNGPMNFLMGRILGLARSVGSLGILSLVIGIGFWIAMISVVVSIFLGGPIMVGTKRFFMCNRETGGRFEMLGYAFKSGNTLHIIWVMFMVGLKTFLWSLLLVIPGIVKSYEYRMIPYILAENPGMDMNRAFELSREMMDGQKMDTFVLDLSFILWNLLGTITWGLANIFYVNPYIAATNAELYAVLRANALQRGITNTMELPGFWET